MNRETFNLVISKFLRSIKKNYDFLVKAGKCFQSAVFQFCQLMFEKDVFPLSFKNKTLHRILKVTGQRSKYLS